MKKKGHHLLSCYFSDSCCPNFRLLRVAFQIAFAYMGNHFNTVVPATLAGCMKNRDFRSADRDKA